MGDEYLYFTTPKPNFAILRGTTADEYGNISMEDEAVFSLVKVAAMAVKQNGGTVVFQVKNLVKGGTLDSQDVAIPGIFVDKIVVCSNPEDLHRQTAGAVNNPAYSGHLKLPEHAIQKLPLDARKVMARRSAIELMPEAVVNLGTGNPEFVGMVATEEGCQDMLTLTVEAGAIGGTPLPGDDFGATSNAWGYMDEDRMFDLYDGGGLDIAFLGLAETDFAGNVNVSKFKGTNMGCGGFIEITQATKRLFSWAHSRRGGLEVECRDGKLMIVKEGKHVKFKNRSSRLPSPVILQTEPARYHFCHRACGYEADQGRLKLVEIAPGIDLEKDILAHMEFTPVMDEIKNLWTASFSV
jgi:propionate CoA-transferase